MIVGEETSTSDGALVSAEGDFDMLRTEAAAPMRCGVISPTASNWINVLGDLAEVEVEQLVAGQQAENPPEGEEGSERDRHLAAGGGAVAGDQGEADETAK